MTIDDSLRERKKRQTRQRISDVATSLFLERGFDEVTVAEIAAACDVSEKTVYNYFPTKESLLLDREERMTDAIRRAFGPEAPTESPIEAALQVLDADLDDLVHTWEQGDAPVGIRAFRRFITVTDSTASLRGARQDMMNRLVQVAAEALAERAGVDPNEPEPQIAADALMGLWRVQFNALRRAALADVTDPQELRRRVRDEVQRAARLIDTGLWAFSVMVTGATDRARFEAAAQLARKHSRQVATAIRDARRSWQKASHEMTSHMKNDLREQRQQIREELLEKRRQRHQH